MVKQSYQQVKFLTSAATLSQLPADRGREIAFVGRSNVGKSSVLNTLCHSQGLARTSKTPGRTQTINLFTVDQNRRLVDLPGYGFAKVPLQMKQRWQQTLAEYLQQRDSLCGLMLIIDCRLPLTVLDSQMLTWTTNANLPTHLLLNKADKLKFGAQQQALREICRKIDPTLVTAQLFSAHTGLGLVDARKVLDRWFDAKEHPV